MILPDVPRRPWTRLVALGDSFTEGLSDVDEARPGQYRGWADRLAEHLGAYAMGHGSELSYANLAVRGRLLADVVGPQLDAALDLQPDLVSIVGGGNDCLRPGASAEALASQLDSAVARVRATGADVLLSVAVDPRDSPFIRRSRGVVAAYGLHVWTIASRHRCYVLDLWGFEALRDWRMWAPDRIHLTTEGHRRVALHALASLGVDPATMESVAGAEDWRAPLPPRPPTSRRAAMREDVQWMRGYATPWVIRRLRGRSSGDGRAAKRPSLEPIVPQYPDAG